MTSWAHTEFAQAQLGDKRLNRRAAQVANDLSQAPTESIPSALPSWQDTKAAYRLFDNPNVSAHKLLASHYEATRSRLAQQQRVLLLQDTSELNYSHHTSKTGIGYLGSESHKGLLIHPLLAITPARLPLGLVSLGWWARKELGAKRSRKYRPITDKESYRWLQHYREGNALAQSMPQTHYVVMGDRESDIHELLMEVHANKASGAPYADIIVRSSHNRRSIDAKGHHGLLRDLVGSSEVLGHIEFEFQPRKGQAKRRVRQAVRASKLTLLAPDSRGERGELTPVEMTVVHTREVTAPKTGERVEWFLLTSMEVGNAAQRAHEIVQWYLGRWDVELYFKCLKSGCGVEQLQLQDSERFMACLAMYMVIAWRILYLMKVARTYPELSCELFLSKTEWQIAYVMIKKKRPQKPPTIGEMIRLVAQVGGYLARKSDGPPGMKTLWRGMSRIRQAEIFNEALGKL